MLLRAKPSIVTPAELRALPAPDEQLGGRLDAIVEHIAALRERVARLEVVILIGVPLVSGAFNYALAHLLR